MDSLRAREPEELFAIARSHWQLSQTRSAGSPAIQVLSPEQAGAAGRSGKFAVLQTVVDDMPFVVDTLMMAVRDTDSPIDWTVHPVICVRRDADGLMREVAGCDSSEGPLESFVHIEFEPLADDAAYAALTSTVAGVFGDLQMVVQDFEGLRQSTAEIRSALGATPESARTAEYAEAMEFLDWLGEHHFTFLGLSLIHISEPTRPY